MATTPEPRSATILRRVIDVVATTFAILVVSSCSTVLAFQQQQKQQPYSTMTVVTAARGGGRGCHNLRLFSSWVDYESDGGSGSGPSPPPVRTYEESRLYPEAAVVAQQQSYYSTPSSPSSSSALGAMAIAAPPAVPYNRLRTLFPRVVRGGGKGASSTRYQKNSPSSIRTTMKNLRTLWPLTRPSNFPGMVILHMFGAYLQYVVVSSSAAAASMASATTTMSYWSALNQTGMWATLGLLLLSSSTTMLINDYYDAKFGRDADRPDRPLAQAVASSSNSANDGSGVSLLQDAKRLLVFLYGASIVCTSFMPGALSKTLAVTGTLLTVLYTEYLKPVTWLKNISTAALTGLAPIVSATALAHTLRASAGAAVTGAASSSWISSLLSSSPLLWQLYGISFFGILGREIMMDCNDCIQDRQSGIVTIPVKYGYTFASRVAFASWIIMSAIAFSNPVGELARGIAATAAAPVTSPLQAIRVMASTPTALHVMRKLALTAVGSVLLIRRGWQVLRCQGRNKEVVDRAIEESMVSVLLYWVSFL